MSIFKENDIRGLYPADWDSKIVERIAGFIPEIINCNNIVIGRDGRETSNKVIKYLIKV